jgi:pyruvate/2-oxoglutarate dehydrogenase complex dihydrolipoamide dehydrogenase (E3) component
MAVDYDLVVIGDSDAGIQAALAAITLKARVAMVDQGSSTTSAMLNHWVLLEMARTLGQAQHAADLGICEAVVSHTDLWGQVKRWSAVAAEATNAAHSPAVLAALGVDVIQGCGEFVRKPAVGFVVNGRLLRSRAYLLAMPDVPVLETSLEKRSASKPLRSAMSVIAGLDVVGYWNIRTALLGMDTLDHLHHLVIIGSDAIEVELAQTFARLGKLVTLITPTPCILPHDDREAAYLIQAQLEADGITVLTDTTVTQVRQIDHKKWVQAGARAIEADELLLATPPKFDPAALNLDAVQVKYDSWGIFVDKKLRTSNPRIYACRSASTNHYAPQLAVSDAKVAVRNALFLPGAAAVWRYVPVVTYSQPELARVGLRESEARALYGQDLMIVQQPFKTLTRSQIQGDTTGFCKFILRRNGSILGAHIVGPQAGEMIGTIALAMQQNIKIQAIAALILPSSSLATIIQQTAAEWHRLRLERNTTWQDFLERFFNWRRSVS